MLNTGLKAPNFKLPDQNGNIINLSDYLGKRIVLYFYSKDMTAGCSRQAVAFKELYNEFVSKNAVVIGISADSSIRHKKFQDKYDLPFILLSDESKEVINLYDVYKEKNMYGKKVMGVVRTTYLIDEKGIIINAFTKVNPDLNPKQMLDIL